MTRAIKLYRYPLSVHAHRAELLLALLKLPTELIFVDLAKRAHKHPEFLAPALPDASRPQFTYAPPQAIAFFVTEPDGSSRFLPHVKGYSQTVDQASLRRVFTLDETKIVPIGLFVKGPAYRLWGLIPMDLHLMGPLKSTDTMYLMGTDKLGRDLLSRLIYGTRVSMSIGLIGVAISLCLGVVLGSLSGFYGGWVDLIGQRFLEVWSGLPVLFMLIILASIVEPNFWWLLGIMALFSWLALVDVVRAEFLRGRNLEYVRAARALGMQNSAIMYRHILPNAMTAAFTWSSSPTDTPPLVKIKSWFEAACCSTVRVALRLSGTMPKSVTSQPARISKARRKKRLEL